MDPSHSARSTASPDPGPGSPEGAAVDPAPRPLRGTLRVPGDKSISHRAALLAGIARGRSLLRGYSPAGDCAATLGVLESLGVRTHRAGPVLSIEGPPSGELRAPGAPLDCGRSGTTMRLLAGILAGRPFRSTLTGDPQLLARPMGRVAEPLRRMGATIRLGGGDRPPVEIEGGPLHGIEYALPVASAQVKSAVLLAGLTATGETSVVEPVPTRDHTERLLAWAGVDVRRDRADGATRIAVGRSVPSAVAIDIPGDPSSAAPILAAAAVVPGSDVVVEGVGLNPTRDGFLRVLRRMGGLVETGPDDADGPEPVGTVRVRHAPLAATAVGADEVPLLIDELPLVAVLATQAEGVTEVRGASELRVKESDRIAALVAGLRALDADAEELPDGFAVRGPTRLGGGRCDARRDHRLAMAFWVAGLAAREPVAVEGMGFVDDSFPGFVRALESLR